MIDPRILAEAASGILAAARSHKRAAAFHKRQAAHLMRTLDEVQRLAREHGIEIEITQTPEGGSPSE
jgi:hypothetical protein